MAGVIESMVVVDAMSDIAKDVVFEFLCVLDGVRFIEDSNEKGSLELYYRAPTGERTMMSSFEEIGLHDLVNPT